MQTQFKNISYLFLAIFLIIFAGFYKTYFGLFPKFSGLPKAAHLHAMTFLIWIGIIIIQPVLIRKKQFTWHKRLGQFTWLLVPIILYSIFLMTRNGYNRDIKTMAKADVLSQIIVPFLDMIWFSSFYIVAMLNTKKLRRHIAFIVGTALLLIGPGFGRLMFYMFGSGIHIPLGIIMVDLLITIAILWMDKKKFNTKILTSPFLLVMLLLIVELAVSFLGESALWQNFAEKIVRALF